MVSLHHRYHSADTRTRPGSLVHVPDPTLLVTMPNDENQPIPSLYGLMCHTLKALLPYASAPSYYGVLTSCSPPIVL